MSVSDIDSSEDFEEERFCCAFLWEFDDEFIFGFDVVGGSLVFGFLFFGVGDVGWLSPVEEFDFDRWVGWEEGERFVIGLDVTFSLVLADEGGREDLRVGGRERGVGLGEGGDPEWWTEEEEEEKGRSHCMEMDLEEVIFDKGFVVVAALAATEL